MNLSTEELFKQMEAGKLLSADVLPKVAKELRRTANSGGALEMRMKSMRVAQGRFFKQVESGADTIFTGGFDVGGGEMFNEMADELHLASAGLEGLGKIFQAVFKIIGNAVKFIMPILDTVFYVLGNITDALIELFQSKSIQIVSGIGLITGAVTLLTTALTATDVVLTGLMRKVALVLLPILAYFAAIDERMAERDPSRTSAREKLAGHQFNANDNAVPDFFRSIGKGDLIGAARSTGQLYSKGYDFLTGSGGGMSQPQTPVNVNVVIEGVDSKLNKELRTFISLSGMEGRQ